MPYRPMTENAAFHYPPELFNLLVDAIPVLNRSKKDVLLFFRGAGVSASLLADLYRRLKENPERVNKFDIALLHNGSGALECSR